MGFSVEMCLVYKLRRVVWGFMLTLTLKLCPGDIMEYFWACTPLRRLWHFGWQRLWSIQRYNWHSRLIVDGTVAFSTSILCPAMRYRSILGASGDREFRNLHKSRRIRNSPRSLSARWKAKLGKKCKNFEKSSRLEAVLSSSEAVSGIVCALILIASRCGLRAVLVHQDFGLLHGWRFIPWLPVQIPGIQTGLVACQLPAVVRDMLISRVSWQRKSNRDEHRILWGTLPLIPGPSYNIP